MREGFLYSSLFHAFIALAFLQHFLIGPQQKKNYYVVDLSLSSLPSGSSLGTQDIATLPENEDYLSTPSTEKNKKQTKPQSPIPKAASIASPHFGAGSARSSVGAGSGIGNFPFPFYIETIQRKIAAQWNSTYWKDSYLLRRAQTAFIIHKDGSIAAPELTEKSGDSYYDLACLRSVSLAAPFPPLPEGFAPDKLKIVFDFEIAP